MDSLTPTLVAAGLAGGGIILTGFVKWVVLETLKDYFTEHLPGLLAIHFSAARITNDSLYADKECEARLTRLEERMNHSLFVKGEKT